MKQSTKILLVVAGVLSALGAIALVASLALNQWNFRGWNTAKYETRTVEIKEPFRSISIRSATEDVEFAVSDDGGCRIVFCEPENETHTAAVTGETLCIERMETGRSVGVFSLFSDETPKITVYLPQTDYASLVLEASTGDVLIPREFTFSTVDVTVSTGNVACYASVSGKLGVVTSTGGIRVEDSAVGELSLSVSTGTVEVRSVACAGTLCVDVSTGKAQLTDVACAALRSTGSTGSITLTRMTAAGELKIERSTGDVRFEQCDAGELEIRTDTGAVTGSLLTEKIFVVRSDTGHIDVPETTTGGVCKITTDTGDIRIRVLN